MSPKRIIVGVAGGIAAYKACSVVRQLCEAGHDVRVIPTEAALHFVGAATFEAMQEQARQYMALMFPRCRMSAWGNRRTSSLLHPPRLIFWLVR